MDRLTPSDPTPRLETERLRLRPMSIDDTETMFTMFGDPETMRYWNTPPLTSLAQARERVAQQIEKAEAGMVLWWGAERREDSRLLGNVTLIFDRRQRDHVAEIGYIFVREHWGHGYANEAQSAVVDYAFDELHLHRLQADVDPRNEASLRSLERLGFKREALLRDAWNVAGEISDSVILGMLSSDRSPS